MIDFHNHILPNIDDGSSSIKVSLKMLKFAEEQGITDVVNTVHYKHPKMVGKDITFERVSKQIRKLQLVLNENNINIKLHFGAETFFNENLVELSNDKLATFLSGKYILIEFFTNLLPKNQKEVLFELKMNGITPIIAHPERYKAVQQNINIVADWLESGCLIQIDAGSPIGLMGKKAQLASEIIIKNKWCQIIGSDAHDDKNRNFCLKNSIKYIYQLIGDDAYKLVNDYPMSVILGRDIDISVNYNNLYKKNIFELIKEKMGF